MGFQLSARPAFHHLCDKFLFKSTLSTARDCHLTLGRLLVVVGTSISTSDKSRYTSDVSHHVGGIVLGCTHFQLDSMDGHVDRHAGVLEHKGASDISNND
jgi:hypothetical protein